jgi:hypothetical protein
MSTQTDKIELLEERVAVLEVQLAEASELMAAMKALQTEQLQNNSMTKELLEAFQSVKGGFKVLGWIGNMAKWVASISAGGAAAWMFWERMTGRR